jgi:hypothetical protein
MFIVWQSTRRRTTRTPTRRSTRTPATSRSSPTRTTRTKGLPLTITALDTYYKGPGYSGNEPQLVGTGFENHACSDWFTAKGGVQPGGPHIGFFIADMGDRRSRRWRSSTTSAGTARAASRARSTTAASSSRSELSASSAGPEGAGGEGFVRGAGVPARFVPSVDACRRTLVRSGREDHRGVGGDRDLRLAEPADRRARPPRQVLSCGLGREAQRGGDLDVDRSSPSRAVRATIAASPSAILRPNTRVSSSAQRHVGAAAQGRRAPARACPSLRTTRAWPSRRR